MRVQNHRRILFIDGSLQGWLISALILLEILMVIVALVYLRYSYMGLIDKYLYSIHFHGDADFFHHLLKEFVLVIVVMSVVNFTALVVANVLWERHINHILSHFRRSLDRIRQLDLSVDSKFEVPSHEVLTRIEVWRQKEATRCQELKDVFLRLQNIDIARRNERLKKTRRALSLLPK